jgi:hypothetical protein
MRPFLLAGVWLAMCGVPTAGAQTHQGHIFGAVHFAISCSPSAQTQFDEAVAMLHSFFYPETEKAFRVIADAEPSCAMAHWGVAISQRPNPLTPPFAPANLKAGLDALQRARAATQATPRERDWIDALAPFFQNAETTPQRARTQLYADAMGRLHAKYPDDTEASVFYALALLEAVDLSDRTYASQLKAADLLERVEAAQPNHPGVAHYIIHAYDYAPLATRGLEAARRYAALASSAPHAVHMPSHIFSTLGMWRDAIETNLAADEANVAYATSVNPAAASNPAAIYARYHALDFLTNAYLQLAEDTKARDIVEQRNSIQVFPPGERIVGHTAYAAIPVRYAFEREAWREAANLKPIVTPFREAEAIVWFGRAIGAARSGDAQGARQNLAEVSRLHTALANGGDPYWAEQVGIQEEAAAAWVALADTQVDAAITKMRSAADREDRSEKHVAMENRLSPMRELLGELLLEADRPQEALREFERSLQTNPNRRRSLTGAARAAERSGNRSTAEGYRKRIPVPRE